MTATTPGVSGARNWLLEGSQESVSRALGRAAAGELDLLRHFTIPTVILGSYPPDSEAASAAAVLRGVSDYTGTRIRFGATCSNGIDMTADVWAEDLAVLVRLVVMQGPSQAGQYRANGLIAVDGSGDGRIIILPSGFPPNGYFELYRKIFTRLSVFML